MTSDGNNTLVYDAENRVASAANGGASGSYTYDGNGQRVVKSSGGATTVSIFLGDQVLAEYDNGALPSAPTNEYIYAGGQRIMSVQSGVTDYWHYDHLSPRLRTDASGNVADQRGTFPFGESWYSPGQSPYMLTTYYRDYESGNDYAQARHYISRLARFSSPDPVPGSASDPQSLNAYSYVESDPANLADPLGLCPSPGICITVSAPYWPSGPSLPSTSAVFFGGAGPDDINAESQIFARTGRGSSSGGFFSRLGNRLACAAEFGDAHSLAAATGTQDSFLGKAFLGNTFSGLTQLGLLAAGGPSGATATDVGIAVLSGTHQGLPGGGNIGKGPLGVAQDAIVGGAATAGYNAVVGAGTQTLELGINASGKVATAVGGLTETAAGTVAGVVGAIKVVGDFAVFGYGFAKCK